MGKHCADVFRPLDLVMGQVARWASRGLAQASLLGLTLPPAGQQSTLAGHVELCPGS